MPSCPPAEWLHPGGTALLLVDLQQGTCGDAQPRPDADFDRRFRATTLPNAERVLAAARRGGLEVIHTVIANLTADGRDRSFDYKRCGMGFPPGSRAAEVIAELAPLADELVLPKSSSSPFSSTSLDYLLRNLGVRTLVVIGLLTDQCIDHTVKDAADRGYRVVCVHDACQAVTPERHTAALACFAGYGAQISSGEFVAELDLAASGEPRRGGFLSSSAVLGADLKADFAAEIDSLFG
ncbi:cysteine hydrolase [Cyanobium sp. Candia 9D4]|uniref:cysteine hydrolase family protein n=1 Tax=Cyanobium sp. Candia 9D4 TaxID=2823707 RepID=UPI0020CF629B|nr:isochorismatase family cysteine hydrolase [Cyanobium sp. Candia 9D4]MCP9933482.1 cysteine hydrolase [Cyanobium sp. Candia 9D4]